MQFFHSVLGYIVLYTKGGLRDTSKSVMLWPLVIRSPRETTLLMQSVGCAEANGLALCPSSMINFLSQRRKLIIAAVCGALQQGMVKYYVQDQ